MIPQIRAKRWLLLLTAAFYLGLFPGSRQAFAENDPPAEPEQEVSVVAEPPVETGLEEGSATRLRYFDASRGDRYLLADEPHTPEQAALYAKLTPKGRENFEKVRIGFLKAALRILQRGKLVAGTGTYLHDKLVQTWSKAKREEAAKSPQTVRSLGRYAIQSLLQSMNTTLFENAATIAEANEFGFAVSLGATTWAGIGKRGRILGVDSGIYIGYQPAKRQAAFEVFVDVDKWGTSLPGAIGAEARVRAGPYAVHLTPETEGTQRTSRVILLPFSILSSSASSLHMGLSVGIGAGTPSVYGETKPTRFILIRGQAALDGTAALKGIVPALLKLPFQTVGKLSIATLKATARWATNLKDRCWAAMSGINNRPPTDSTH